MNEQELKEWFHSAHLVLIVLMYSEAEIEIILDWFRNIQGSAERLLIGNEAVDAHSIVAKSLSEKTENWLSYSLMSRLVIYSPLILKQNNEN